MAKAGSSLNAGARSIFGPSWVMVISGRDVGFHGLNSQAQMAIMNQMRLRKFSTYTYRDPRKLRVELRQIELSLVGNALDQKVLRLRTNGLKAIREARDAATFCVGLSELSGVQHLMATVEDEDFDFVTTWVADDTQHFCPVQLKEVPPEDLNASSSIDTLLNRLSQHKYGDSKDLTVAIKLNQRVDFDPTAVKIPEGLQLGGLWVFGSISTDQSEWGVWGDFMAKSGSGPFGVSYDYPS